MQKIYFDKNFSPAATLECGQVFRYKKEGDCYTVHALDKECRIYRDGDGYYMLSDDEKFFKNYFDFDGKYDIIIDNLSSDENLREMVEFGKGIRILNQNPFEMIISFIISQNNNIPRIKTIIERLCASLGRDMGTYFAFPTLEDMAACDEEFYFKLGTGYRANYLESVSKALLNVDLSSLFSLDTESLRTELLKLKGVGRKVADCILLFGFHRLDVFPVDTWIKKIFSAKMGDISADEMSKRLVDKYGDKSGLVQQYLYYYARENKIDAV